MKKQLALLLTFCLPKLLYAQQVVPQGININVDSFLKPGAFSSSINLLLAVSVITLVPFFLVSTTSFLRIVIVLSLTRQAVGTAQSPPNSVIISLALFMTVFIMTPTFQEINTMAFQPYQEGKISQRESLEIGLKPFHQFMLRLTRDKDLALFLEFSQLKVPKDQESIPISIVIPAFILSELKASFQIAFLLFIPFLIIDLIVSNVLLSLGMFMLSPAMISLPFKILLFVLTDGWNLLTRGLLLSFIQ